MRSLSLRTRTRLRRVPREALQDRGVCPLYVAGPRSRSADRSQEGGNGNGNVNEAGRVGSVSYSAGLFFWVKNKTGCRVSTTWSESSHLLSFLRSARDGIARLNSSKLTFSAFASRVTTSTLGRLYPFRIRFTYDHDTPALRASRS